MNLNTVILGGNLTSDPASPGTGKSLCTFTLSFEGPFDSDRGGVGRRRDFVAVVAFGKSAEACLRFLKKGSKIVVDGRLKQDRWQSAVSGQHSRMTVVADRVHFVSGLKKEGRIPGSDAGGEGSLAVDPPVDAVVVTPKPS